MPCAIGPELARSSQQESRAEGSDRTAEGTTMRPVLHANRIPIFAFALVLLVCAAVPPAAAASGDSGSVAGITVVPVLRA